MRWWLFTFKWRAMDVSYTSGFKGTERPHVNKHFYVFFMCCICLEKRQIWYSNVIYDSATYLIGNLKILVLIFIVYGSSTPVDDPYTKSYFFLTSFSPTNIAKAKLCLTYNIAKWLYFIVIASTLRYSLKFFFMIIWKKKCTIHP